MVSVAASSGVGMGEMDVVLSKLFLQKCMIHTHEKSRLAFKSSVYGCPKHWFHIWMGPQNDFTKKIVKNSCFCPNVVLVSVDLQ